MTTIEIANNLCKNTLMETLGIVFTKVEEGNIEATMPVTNRHKQPMGLLHGGANAALAESVGSLGSALLVDIKKYAVVGLQLSANHLKSVSEGMVIAKGSIVHKGRTTHLWNIDVFDENDRLLSSCRMTNYIKTL
jgi:1,4-dihydroxy-2-naphthoyl-CoA hydrolase